jgi:poly-gamma-glutamate capsule biosynthesis protein CapA/YwtB (metallophosphatase superfamily)
MPRRAEALAERRRRARRQTLLTVLVVSVLAVGGGYALLATKATASSPPSPAGQRRPAAAPKASPHGATAKAQATVSITWVGDMNFGTLGNYPPGGSASLLSAVAADLHSNLTIGNLETALGAAPLTKCAPGESNCFAYEAPAATAQALRQDGFAAVNVANNHTMDAGTAGEDSTDAALRAAGLVWDGRPGQITYLTRKGIKIALLGFAPWPYDASMLDIPAAEALVRQARAHAQVVIVIIHAGAEGASAQHVRPGMETYLGEERGDSIAFTHGVIDAGADLVMGSGPHVLRAMQWYHGHLIAYSLGNFCGYNTLGLHGPTAEAAILHVTLRADGTFVRGSIAPIRLAEPGIPEADPAGTAIGLINTLSQDDFPGNGAVHISARGIIPSP